MSVLWHYTCDHGRASLGESGHLTPGASRAAAGALAMLPPAALTAARFVWLTDLDTPIRDALGLTSHILSCDRTAHRYRVTDDRECTSFTELLRMSSPGLYALLRPLTETPGAMPAHWWVAARPVPVTLDPPKDPRP